MIINIKNMATCFGSLNHPQTNSQNTVLVHSASAHIVGSHTVYLWSSVSVLYMGNPCEANDSLLRLPHVSLSLSLSHTHKHTHTLDFLGIIQQVFTLVLYSNYANWWCIRMYIYQRLLNKHRHTSYILLTVHLVANSC